MCRDLRAHRLKVAGGRAGLRVARDEPDVHLLHLVEKRLLQMEALRKRLGLNSTKSPQNTDMTGLDDHTYATQSDADQDDNDNERNETFKSGIHGK